MFRSLARALVPLALLAGVMACGGSPKPPVKVLAVTDAHQRDASPVLLVLLEVRNPTKRQVSVAGLDYQLEATPWFETRGSVTLTRSIGAGGSAVIEIPVKVDDDARPRADGDEVPYTLDGFLRVRSGSVESRWPVRARGELSALAGAGARTAYVTLPPPAAR
jgi:hypothetical protein